MGLTKRPPTLAQRQAVAAVGQIHLMRYYQEFFQALGLVSTCYIFATVSACAQRGLLLIWQHVVGVLCVLLYLERKMHTVLPLHSHHPLLLLVCADMCTGSAHTEQSERSGALPECQEHIPRAVSLRYRPHCE